MTSRSLARSATLLVLAAAGLAVCAGCAISTPHMNIRQWPGAARAGYYHEPAPVRVGVLPLVDQRPAVEHSGKRPTGMFLLLWNRRVGDYYTGDRVFGGEVTSQLTDQLVQYLKAGNVFADVVRVQPPTDFNPADPTSVSTMGRSNVVHYLLRGEVQHFYGSQTQHTMIYLLPLYFVNTFGWEDSKTLPWGKTSIQFTLYDAQTGDLVWRRLIEYNQTLPRDKDPMSQAALESFTGAAGELSTDLRTIPLPSTMPSE